MFANAATCRYQFWEAFQSANLHVHHNEDYKEFVEFKKTAGKTSKDKKPETFPQEIETDLKRFTISQKQGVLNDRYS